MKMQDKEFDDVLRSKLEGFETEPSEKVWGGIDSELDSARRRAVFVPLLRIAAIVVVAVTAGLLFIPKHSTVTGNKKPKLEMVKNTGKPALRQDPTEPVAGKTGAPVSV